MVGKGLIPLYYFLQGGDAELERHTWAVGYGHIHLWSVPMGLPSECDFGVCRRGGTASVPLGK